jgi:glycosyltransferase involved in cell wall biosynthesis
MRITYVEPDGTGGLSHFAYEICEALAQRGHTVRLHTSSDCELRNLPRSFELAAQMRLWPRTSRQEGRGVRRLLQRGRRGIRLTKEWARLTRQILADRPDFVLFSEILFPHLGFFLWLLRLRGIKLGQICHEFNYQEREGATRMVASAQRILSKFVYRQFEHIVFLSEATRSAFLERFDYPASRTSRIPHGSQSIFPPPRRSPSEFRAELGLQAEPVILFFGSIRESKGLPDLIRAIARSRSREKARLVIAGQPTKHANMDTIGCMLEDLGLSDRVVVRAAYIPMEDVASYFEIARCVVLPYRSATQSGVAHLAYRYGRPVIATAVGGLAEDVLHEQTGLLVRPGAIGELAAAIDRLVDDVELAEHMGDRARELSRTRFSWEEAARILDAGMTAVVKGSPATSLVPADTIRTRASSNLNR